MSSKPSRLQTVLLMLPTWAFSHAVMLFRVLPEKDLYWGAGIHSTHKLVLFALAAGCALLASYVAARRAAILGWSLPPVLGLLIHVPFVGMGLVLWLAASGDEQEKDSVAPTAVAGRLAGSFARHRSISCASWRGTATPMASSRRGACVA